MDSTAYEARNKVTEGERVACGCAEVWGRSRSTMAEAPPDTIDRVLLFSENGDGSGPLNDGDKCDDDARRTGFLPETDAEGGQVWANG